MNAVWFGVTIVLLAALGGLAWALYNRSPSFRPAPDFSTPFDPDNPLVRALSRELRALEALPIASKQDRTRWHDEAAKIRAKLRGEYASIYDSLPHELEHYFDDADIRAKAPVYAENQLKQLAMLFRP